MAKELSDDALKSILEGAISKSEHLTDGKLHRERLNVEKYYRGELPEQMHKGDSKYVSRDVFDAVDSMRATVVEAFLAHNRIVTFRPELGETVADAKQQTEYSRHVFFKENDGEDILYDVLTDGLMKRLSVVKVFYEEETDEDEYEFEALTPEELTATVEGFENFEFTEAEIDENGLYGGTFTVTNTKKSIQVEVLQPEDFLISSRTAEIADAKYAIHRYARTKSKLLKDGYDKALVNKIVFSGSRDLDMEYEKQQRFEVIDDVISTDDGYQPAVEETTVYEVYINLDMQGKGTTKLWKIVYAGGIVLDKEQIARMPFATFVPLPTPHTFFGDNFAEGVIPVQNARTVLIRQIINHSLVTNNPRLMVLNGTVHNSNELTDNRAGGIINVRRMDGLAPVQQAPLNPFVFNLIQMIDEDKEEVTGISKLSQGLNKDAISTQNAEGMVEQLISQSQQRTKIIARRFGKFVKDLFLLINATAIDYIDEAQYVAVTGEYVEVNPSSWLQKTAASVELTLGYGEMEKEATKWMELDAYFKADPILSQGYDYAKSYELTTRSLEKRGIEDVATFLTPPDELKPPEPSEAEVLQLEQLKAQIALQNAQAQSMMMKAETDKIKAEADLIKAQTDARSKVAKASLEEREFEHESFIDMEELAIAKATPMEQTKVNANLND